MRTVRRNDETLDKSTDVPSFRTLELNARMADAFLEEISRPEAQWQVPDIDMFVQKPTVSQTASRCRPAIHG